MVHKFSDRADEQRKEAEVVRLRTPLRTICIDWSTGQICAPEPIEHGGHVIPKVREPLARQALFACVGRTHLETFGSVGAIVQPYEAPGPVSYTHLTLPTKRIV